MGRLALHPFTVSNGMTIPAGTRVTVPTSTTHRDERIYAKPDEFDRFRFAKLRKSEGDDAAARHQMTSTSTGHFEDGKNALRGFCIAGILIPGTVNVMFS
jgi:hypothetical protein